MELYLLRRALQYPSMSVSTIAGMTYVSGCLHGQVGPGHPCGICGCDGSSFADHCHTHRIVRSRVCVSCNGLMASIDRRTLPARDLPAWHLEALVRNAANCPYRQSQSGNLQHRLNT